MGRDRRGRGAGGADPRAHRGDESRQPGDHHGEPVGGRRGRHLHVAADLEEATGY